MKRFTSIALASVLAFGGMGVMASSASATHPQVSGVATCDTTTGLFDIDWTVTGDPGFPDVTAVIRNTSRPLGFEGKVAPQTATEQDLVAGTYDLYVEVQFSNHKEGDVIGNTGSVTAGGDCVKDIPKPDPVVTETSSDAKDCDSKTVTTVTVVTTTDWVKSDSGEWVKGEPVVTETSSTRETTEQECPTPTQPPITTPPVTEPPATTPPVTTPPVITPEPAPTAAPQARVAQGEELAYTGTDNWLLAGVGFFIAFLGFLLFKFSRKSD